MIRKLLALAIASLSFCISFAQNNLDPAPLTLTGWNKNVMENQTGYVKGWNWGSIGGRLNDAIGINYWHNGAETTEAPFYSNNQKRIVAIGGTVTGGHLDPNLLNSQAFVFKPGIAVDSTSSYHVSAYDSYCNVFGFLNRDVTYGRVGDSLQYILYDSLFTAPSNLVLSDIWPKERFWL